MKLHELTNTPGARQRVVRLGRGEASGVGKTSGRGHKGQWARKGHKFKEGFEGGQMRLIRRIPKSGFKNPARVIYIPVNVSLLSGFKDGAEITADILKKAGIVKRIHCCVKILGNGELDKKLTVKAHAFSASAKAKIEAKGGTCEVISA